MPNPKKGEDKMIKRLAKVRKSQEIWEASVRMLRTWIVEDDDAEPYRPYVIMVVSNTTGAVIRSELSEEKPTEEQFLFEVFQAMLKPFPGTGTAQRPWTIHMDGTNFVTFCTPRFAEIGVHGTYRKHLPILTQALTGIEEMMHEGEYFPGVLSIPKVTVPLVTHIYKLVAKFYTYAPWRWLDDKNPIAIAYPPEAPPRYAIVMGSGGEVFGLSISDKREHLPIIYSNIDPLEQYQQASTFAFFFTEKIDVSFDDLEAIETYGWEIADEEAYPVFARTDADSIVTMPSAEDMFWLEGALEALIAHFREYNDNPACLSDPLHKTFSVSPIGGSGEVLVQIPGVDPIAEGWLPWRIR